MLGQQGPAADVGYDLGVTGVSFAIKGFVKRSVLHPGAFSLQIMNRLVN